MSVYGENTVIGLFDDIQQASDAVRDLEVDGFPSETINLVANAAAQEYTHYFDDHGHYSHLTDASVENHVKAAGKVGGVGAALGGLGGLLVGLALLTIPGVGPVVAAGPLAATLVGAGAGAAVGGMIGAFTNAGVDEVDAEYYAEAIRRGGVAVVMRTDSTRVNRAAEILNRHHPVHIQDRVETWRKAGWSKYDPNAVPYTASQANADGLSYLASEPVGPPVTVSNTPPATSNILPR